MSVGGCAEVDWVEESEGQFRGMSRPWYLLESNLQCEPAVSLV